MARRPERRKRTTAAIAAASKLAGEIRTGATGLDFANQTHWERERGGEGELVPGLGATGESPQGPLHGRRPWSSPELVENGSRDHKTK